MSLDVARAESLYARALHIAGSGHRDRPTILVRWAEALRQRGRYRAAADAFEEAIGGFRSGGDVRAAAHAMSKFSVLLYALGDPRQLSLALESVELLEALPPSEELMAAYANVAGSTYVTGDNPEAVSWAEKAIALASRLGLSEPVRAIGFRGGARSMLGDPEGQEDMRRALDLAVTQGLGREAAVLYNNLGVDQILIQGPRAALEVLEEGIEFCERRGIEEFAVAMALSSLGALIDSGRFQEAIDRAAEASERAAPVDLAVLRRAEALVHLRRGEVPQAATASARLVEMAREMKDPQSIGTGLPIEAMVQLTMGNAEKAVSLLVETIQTRNVAAHPHYVMTVPDMIRTALAAGDDGLARQILSGLEPLYPYHRCDLLAGRALLAEREGDHEGAAELFADAELRWSDLGIVWEEAQAALGQGRDLLALRRGRDAIDALRRAREIFGRLGARPAQEETDVILGQATALTS
jgi:tetratricopeptide (TPR) repeat protein